MGPNPDIETALVGGAGTAAFGAPIAATGLRQGLDCFNIVIYLIIKHMNISVLTMPAPRSSLRPTWGMQTRPKPPLVEFGRSVPPVRRVPMALARRFFQICTTAVAEVLAAEDLTPLQYAVIAYVEGEPDIDQNSLAARIGIDRNNVSLLVEQLESKRLIERRVNGADRRARLLRVTARCQKLYDRLRPTVFGAQERLLMLLRPAEREQLLDLLVRVIEGNRALARPGSGRRRRSSRQSPSERT